MRKLLLLLVVTFCLNTNAQIITAFAGNGYGASTGGNAGFFGQGQGAYGGDGGQATNAQLWEPTAIAIDNAGNMYIAEVVNNVVRKVSTNGIISTFAGVNASSGYTGDGGPATAATLSTPEGLAVDAAGNVYIADNGANVIRMVNTNGIISTFAGNHNGPCTPPTGHYCGDGGSATNAALYLPEGLIFDAAGNLYICDNGNYCVRKVDTNGIITTVAGGGTVTTDGGQATAASIGLVTGVKVDAVGNMYIANGLYVKKVDPSGIITTVAGNGTSGFSGDGGQATAAEIGAPYDIILDKAGNLYIADKGYNSIRKVYPNGIITTIAGNGNIAGAFTGNNGLATAARFDEPTTFAFDAADNLYITDAYNNQIRKITSPCNLLVSGVSSICLGSSAVLSVNGATSYTWSANAGGGTTNTVSVSPTSSTVYTVTGVNGNCTATQTISLTVNTVPTLSLTGNTYAICSGSSQVFGASGASTYTWTPTTNLASPNSPSPSANPSAPIVYTVTGSNVCGTATSPLTVSITAVNPLPTISVVASNTLVCLGTGAATLTASGASTYTWANSATLSSATGSIVTSTQTYTTLPTTYTINGTDANGCKNKSTITIKPTTTPTISVVGGNLQNVCAGAAVSGITFSTSPAGSASWSNSNTLVGLAASGSGNIASYTAPTVTVQTFAVITASATVNGCTSSNIHYTLTINPLPGETGATISPSNCGSSNGTIMGATGTGGSGNYSYEWNNTGGFVNSSSYTNGAGTYPLQIKDVVTGCIYSQNFIIPNASAPSPPTITASATSACVGGAVTFSVPVVIGTTYNWTDITGGNGTGNTYAVNNLPASPNPFTVMVTATNMGCTGTASTFSTTVNPTPTVNITPLSSSTICSGTNVVLSISGANTYTLLPTNQISAAGFNFTVTPTSNTTFTLVGIDGTTGCTNTAITSVIVNPRPIISLQSVDVSCNNACNGSASVTINSGSPPYVINWPSAGTQPITNGLCPGTYTCLVADAMGCKDSATAIISQPLALTLAATQTNVSCFGGTDGTAAVAESGGTLPYVYMWSTSPVQTLAVATGLPAGQYTVIVQDANGCQSTASITITQPAAIPISFTLTQDAVPHTWDAYPNYPPSISSYLWSWGDGTFDNTVYPSHTYSVAGTYSICVTVTDAAGCSTTYCQNDAVARLGNNSTFSDMVYINVLNGNLTTGISQTSGLNSQISVYPNPTTGSFVVETNATEKQLLNIYDVTGKLAMTQTINTKATINASQLAEGIYNMSIISNEGVVNKRLVIVR